MHYFLSIIIKMCLANLIIITPTPSSTTFYPKTQESNETTTYSQNELIPVKITTEQKSNRTTTWINKENEISD